MTWDERAKQAAQARSFDTPKRSAAVARRVDAIKAKHRGPRGTWGWAEPRPLTDADWDALQVSPITGDRWDRTPGGDCD